jgi:DNA polymerase-3 subunit gamma/tau
MLYRKYRPQTWKDLYSENVRTTLGRAVLNNDWAHAYLLIGTRGSGKTTTARLIAKTVNCVDRKKGEEPCNKCEFCQAITNSASLDVIEIDAASNTGVDDIRDLREKVRLAPSGSKYKVYIIDEVHMLSANAFNALLKTLEEPPAHVIFVLCTTEAHKIPETIVSRCLVYDFGRATPTEIKKNLERVVLGEDFKIKEEILEVVISKAAGSHRDAIKILEQVVSSGADINTINSAKDAGEKIADFLLARQRKSALEELERYTGANGKTKDLLGEIVSSLRDRLLSEDPGEAVGLIPRLIEANTLLRDSPVASLPLELVIVEWCGDAAKNESVKNPSTPQITNITGVAQDGSDSIVARWPEIVAATKPFNHSLNAFLKAAKPAGVKDNFLVIEVAYKFHKEKLEEPKNRDVLERVISDTMGKNLKVRFELKTRG